MGKIIVVLLDGLKFSTARGCMSFLRSLEDRGMARGAKMRSCLPPLSRPAYATILTGEDCATHGVCRNDEAPGLPGRTIFTAAADAGLSSCAAAYGWFFELLYGRPFDLRLHRVWTDAGSAPEHGIFYASDAYPDAELFADAEFLRNRHEPHLLLAHSMGIDNAGHIFGGDSPQYREAARNADALLAMYAPIWLQNGYSLLILSDHGMGMDKSHYDVSPDCLEIPVWICGPSFASPPASLAEVAPLLGHGLGLPWP